MKKVKTVITSLLILFASAFMTACSCGGTGSVNPGDIVHVYETGISISSDHTGAEKDEESGYLTIRVHLNDEFKITYDLSPLNVTTTQVDWEFLKNDDIVVPKNNLYSYSQDRTHTITFKAKKVGNTELQFKTKATGKITKATIIVGEAPQALPKFVEVTGVDYDAEAGKLTWAPVTKQKLYTGQIVDAPTSNGVVAGLTGYELQITDLTNDVELENVKVTKCEYELPKGVTYAVKVRALGDGFGDGYGFTVSNGSFPNESFKFHQIATATELSNNNGTVSYKTPIHAFQNRIYFDDINYVDRSNAEPDISVVDSYSLKSKVVVDLGLSQYAVSVQSFPQYYQYDLGYALDSDTGIRYYPSVRTEALNIEKLDKPNLSIIDQNADFAINGTTIGQGLIDKPYVSSIINWTTNKDGDNSIKYLYAIYKNDVKIIPSNAEFAEANGNSFDTSTLWYSGAGSYTIKVKTIGSASKTIESEVSEFSFSLLKIENATINNGLLTSSQANDWTAGLELYFINSNNPEIYYTQFVAAGRNSKTVQYNIANKNLPAGSYSVYGRFG